MMNNMDRFSSPLETERVNPYHLQQMIEEQNYLNHKHIIDAFISNYWNKYSLVPDTETIQEVLYYIDLDEDMINERRRLF